MNEKLLIPGAIIIAGLFIAGGIFLAGEGSFAKSDVQERQQVDQGGEFGNSLSDSARNVRPVDADDHVFGNPNVHSAVEPTQHWKLW